MIDFEEKRREKERGMSNEAFYLAIDSYVKQSQACVVITVDAEGIIQTWQTSDSHLYALGMIEVAKTQIMEAMEV